MDKVQYLASSVSKKFGIGYDEALKHVKRRMEHHGMGALADASAKFYNHPAFQLTVLGLAIAIPVGIYYYMQGEGLRFAGNPCPKKRKSKKKASEAQLVKPSKA
jgi:hypothetical protein